MLCNTDLAAHRGCDSIDLEYLEDFSQSALLRSLFAGFLSLLDYPS